MQIRNAEARCPRESVCATIQVLGEPRRGGGGTVRWRARGFPRRARIKALRRRPESVLAEFEPACLRWVVGYVLLFSGSRDRFLYRSVVAFVTAPLAAEPHWKIMQHINIQDGAEQNCARALRSLPATR
jgi:hypothetical protein